MVDFIKLLSQQDVVACQRQLTDLISELSNDPAAWEEPLMALTQAMDQHYSSQVLAMVLNTLPKAQLETFVAQLMSLNSLPPEAAQTVTAFLLPQPQLSNEHFSRLIKSLFCSSYALADEALVLICSKLEPKVLSSLFGALRQQMPHKLSEFKDKSSKKQMTLSYQKKHDILLNTLCVHASNSVFLFANLIQDNPELANLIVMRRLSYAKDERTVQKIIDDLLYNGHFFDWQAPDFKASVLPKFCELLSSKELPEATALFKDYARLEKKGLISRENIIRFLDKLYLTKHSVDLLLACVQSIDDADASFIINFLTLSELQESEIIEKLIALLPFEMLPNLTGHVMALGQGQLQGKFQVNLFEKFISAFCQRLQERKQTQVSLRQMAEIAKDLPPSAQEQLLRSFKQTLSAVPTIYAEWLKAALFIYDDRSLLIPFCYQLILEQAQNVDLLLPLLKPLQSKDTLRLFVHFHQQKAPVTAYEVFKRLFSAEEKFSHLCYVLTETPVIPQDVLQDFLRVLNDKTLLTLLDSLFVKVQENSEYTNTFNQALLVFCSRLGGTSNEKDFIHEWDSLPSMPGLAIHVLKNPECVYALSITNSRLWQLMLWENDSDALKLRINRFLNSVALDEHMADQLLRSWLSYFQLQPEKLHQIFSVLERTDSGRESQAQSNYLELKKACWSLLGKEGDYSEEAFQAFMPSLAFKTSYDPFLQKLIREQSLAEHPQEGAQLLALTIDTLPPQFDADQFIPILIHSLQDDYLVNWQKVAVFLSQKSPEDNLAFFQNLIQTVQDKQSNPVLLSQTHALMLKSPHFHALLKALPQSAFFWFLENTPQVDLKKHLKAWLDVLVAHHGIEGLPLGKLLLVLPREDEFPLMVLNRKEMNDPHVFAALFVELSADQRCEEFMPGLKAGILAHDKAWLFSFLTQVLENITPDKTSLVAVRFLNTSMLSLASDFSIDDPKARGIFDRQLRLLEGLIESNHRQMAFDESRQMMLHLIKQFNQKDPRWANHSMRTAAFTQLVRDWLADMNLSAMESTLSYHALTQLLLEHLTVELDPLLIADQHFQAFIKCLLENPSSTMSSDAYLILFDRLAPDLQKDLVIRLCESKTFCPLFSAVLPVMARALTIHELYALYEKKPHLFLMIEMLFHHEDLPALSDDQRKALVDKIESSEQLLKLLDSHSQKEKRSFVVDQIYASCNNDWQLLADKLLLWGMDRNTLAALANFTLGDTNKALFKNLLEHKPYYLTFIDAYIQKPSLDMRLVEQSYLNDRVSEMLSSPDFCCFPAAIFLDDFSPEFRFSTLKKQFSYHQQWQGLFDMLEPFKLNEDEMPQAIAAARWVLHLPLYLEGLLFVYEAYQPRDLQDDIWHTKLMEELIEPLLIEKKQLSAQTVASQLPGLLRDYAKQIPAHENVILELMDCHESKLNMISKYLSPRITDYLNVQKDMGRLNFQEQDSEILMKASELFEENAQKNTLNNHFVEGFRRLIQSGALENKQISQWLFTNVFVSPLSSFIDHKVLKDYFQALPPDHWIAWLTYFYHRKNALIKILQPLVSLLKTSNIRDVFAYLDKEEPKQLLFLSKAAQDMNLMHLSNVIRLVHAAKTMNFSVEDFFEQILPQAMDRGLNIEWLLQDVRAIEPCLEFLKVRYEDLVAAAFAYHPDAYMPQRLETLMRSGQTILSESMVRSCLVSYGPLFTDKRYSPAALLQTVEEILKMYYLHLTDFVGAMQGDLVLNLIQEALKSPKTHQNLLHLFLNSTYKGYCQQQLKSILASRLGQEEIEDDHLFLTLILQKSPDLTSEEWIELLSILRLLMIADPKPELLFLNSYAFLPESLFKKQAFLGDLSCYYLLLEMQQSGEGALVSQGMSWLIDQCKTGNIFFAYQSTFSSLMWASPEKIPKLNYHWYLWKYQLDQDPMVLVGGFFHYLQALREVTQEESLVLFQMLDYIAQQQHLDLLCQYVEEELQDEGHRRCLAHAMVSLKPFKLDYLSYLINICSQPCLEELMPQITQESLAPWSIDEIRTFLDEVDNKSLQTLSAIHLLTRKDYFQRLQGESFLKQLDIKQPHQPSRLQPLLQWIDQGHADLLTVDVINHLEPEAAVSCLCSLRHFHLWTEAQVAAFTTRYPQPELIYYWLEHYSLMPNAMKVFPHLLRLADSHVFNYMTKTMQDDKRQRLISRMVEHIHDFYPLKRDFIALADESHLCLAIELFHQAQIKEGYVPFITRLTERLIKSKHDFSPAAIHALLSLQSSSKFDDLNARLAYPCNEYVRKAAVNGDISLFYKQTGFNFSQTTINLSLNTKKPEKKYRDIFKSAIAQMSMAHSKDIVIDEADEKVEGVAIESLYYFIFHYKRQDSKAMNDLLSDVLDAYHYVDKSGYAPLRPLSALLLMENGVPKRIKSSIYHAFKSRLELLDDPVIAHDLFEHDAMDLIKELGDAKEYKKLIALAKKVLKEDQKIERDSTQARKSFEPELKTMIKDAKAHAKFELKLSKMTGSFLGLRRWFKRGRMYGWKGFFSPKASVYVLAHDQSAIVHPILRQDPPAHRHPEKTAEAALEAALQSHHHVAIYEALRQYHLDVLANQSPSWDKKRELALRLDVEKEYATLLRLKVSDVNLASWLEEYEACFIENRHCILQLALENAAFEEIRGYLKDFADTNEELRVFEKEFEVEEVLSQEEASSQTAQKEANSGVKDDIKHVVDSVVDGAFSAVNKVASATMPTAERVAQSAAPTLNYVMGLWRRTPPQLTAIPESADSDAYRP